MNILGIGGLTRDGAAALIREGQLVAAIEERKITRQRHGGGLPLAAIAECLRVAGTSANAVQHVALARPLPAAGHTHLHLELRRLLPNAQVHLVEHHEAHAASAYALSGFDNATVLTLDRGGDFRCGARWTGSGGTLHLDNECYFPDSIGDLYSRVTRLFGFIPGQEEHKVQWLSAAGDGKLKDLFLDILGMADSSWPRVDRSYVEGVTGFSEKFFARLGVTGGTVPQAMQIAVASGLQQAVEEAVLRMTGDATHLAVAGGLFFNVLLVAALEKKIPHVFVQPAAGNNGTALGAACWTWHHVLRRSERIPLATLALGPGFQAEEIKQVVENCKLRFRYLLTTDELIDLAVAQLHDQNIIAWMQGRTEFGPRALGNRSILASPLDPFSSENLNVFIKHREPFRKFAASVPAELAAEYFDVGPNARFLATVGRVKPAHRKTFEGAILGSDLVRIHTVSHADNPLYHRLLHAFGKATGLPVLYNTSFNLFGDPLVSTPRDAVRSFYSSGIDAMFVGHFFLEK